MSVIIYLITFLFLYASISSEIFREPGVYYFLLLVSLLIIGFWYEFETKEEVFPREHFKLSSLLHQILGGFVCLLIFLIPILLLGRISPVSPVKPTDFFQTLFLNVVIVGMVETVMLVVYVRVVWLGILVFPFLFAFTHPSVAPLWTKGIFTQESVIFFAYAVCMAFIFILMFLMRDILKPKMDKKGNPLEEKRLWKYFGAVQVAVFHGGINAVAIISMMTIGGLTLGL